MSAYDVLGKNVTLEMKIDSDWFPVFCAKEVGLTKNHDKIETTHVNSGINREYVPGMANSSVVCNGVTTNNSGNGRIPVTYLMQDTVSYAMHNFRVKLTDNNTVANVVVMLFSGFFENMSFSGPRGAFSNSSASIVVSGPVEYESSVDSPAEPVCEVFDPIYKDAIAGQTSVQDDLIKQTGEPVVTILLVSRTGDTYTPTTGTPGSMQYRYVAATGVIEFDPLRPFEAGEVVSILYKVVG